MGRSLGSTDLRLVIMMSRRGIQLDMGVEGQDQMFVSRFIRPMLVSCVEMKKWITSKREDEQEG